MSLNLPKSISNKEEDVKRYFNTYYQKQLAYPSNEVDAVIGFLESKGFGTSAAQSTGAVLLQQAKIDNIKVFELLDTLKGFDEIKLSAVVAEVLNYNRLSTSVLGFKNTTSTDTLEKRNIVV